MSGQPTPSVLIVEDSWLLAAEVESWLRDEGIEVVGPAANATEALQIADQARPSYALVDFNLGGVLADGLIEQLLERDIGVIVVTGYADIGAVSDRVRGVLHKPCNKSQVLKALKAAGLQIGLTP